MSKRTSPLYTRTSADSADSLKNGKVDAAFIVAGAPTTAITDLSTSKQAYLVSMDAKHIAKLQETSSLLCSCNHSRWHLQRHGR